MKNEIRIALGISEFERLVSGEMVTVPADGGAVKIILSDIGFEFMRQAIRDAELARAIADETE